MINQIDKNLTAKYIVLLDNILITAPECFQIDIDKGEISGMITNWIKWSRKVRILSGRNDLIKEKLLRDIRKINGFAEKKFRVIVEKVLGFTNITYRYWDLKKLLTEYPCLEI